MNSTLNKIQREESVKRIPVNKLKFLIFVLCCSIYQLTNCYEQG